MQFPMTTEPWIQILGTGGGTVELGSSNTFTQEIYFADAIRVAPNLASPPSFFNHAQPAAFAELTLRTTGATTDQVTVQIFPVTDVRNIAGVATGFVADTSPKVEYTIAPVNPSNDTMVISWEEVGGIMKIGVSRLGVQTINAAMFMRRIGWGDSRGR